MYHYTSFNYERAYIVIVISYEQAVSILPHKAN